MKEKHLLVMIDDDTEDHEIFKIAVSEIEMPLKLLFFSSCEEALAHFQQPGAVAPGFVFIDLNLPRISGEECLQRLHELSEFDHPRIIVYSSSIPTDWHGKLEAIGVDQFLEKSGSIQALTDELKKLLES